MKLPRFTERPGPATLNGPIFEGYAFKMQAFLGPGVVMGADVMVVATDPHVAEALANYLEASPHVVENSGPIHVLIGQPPWYQNETKELTLEDALPSPAPRRTRIKATNNEDSARTRPGLLDGLGD